MAWNKRGFTLVEVMVSLVCAVMIAAAAAQLIGVAGRAARGIKKAQRGLFDRMNCITLLERDCANSVQDEAVYPFSGQADSMDFYTMISERDVGTIVRVTYTILEKQSALLREIRQFPYNGEAVYSTLFKLDGLHLGAFVYDKGKDGFSGESAQLPRIIKLVDKEGSTVAAFMGAKELPL